MKFSILFRALVFTSFALYLASCQDDQLFDDVDAEGQGSANIVVGNGVDFDLPGNTLWTNSNVYFLDGIVRVPAGITLTIQPGTRIEGLSANAAGVSGTLIVEQGGVINAQGTPNAPIVFTSNESRGARQPGDWAGIIIAGRAYANVAAGTNGNPNDYVGYIEGIRQGLDPVLYGSGSGNRSVGFNDNSGILQYVRIEYAGDVISEGDETNGLTLGGVGNGTTIDHVQVSLGADDGFEWFGGSVDAKYLIGYRNTDDDFDADQGYFGKVQFAFAIKDPFLASGGSGGSRGLEINGDLDDAVNTNVNFLTDGTFSNFTIIGPHNPSLNNTRQGSNPGSNPNGECEGGPLLGNFDVGVALRDGTQLDLFNSVIIGFPEFQIFFEDPGLFPNPLRNRTNYAVIPPFPRTATMGSAADWVNINRNDWVSQGNVAAGDPFNGCGAYITATGYSAAAFLLPDFGSQPQPDLRPVVGSPILGGANFASAELASPFFNVVNYRGAFDRAATGWNINFGVNPNNTWALFVPNVPAYN